MVSRDTNSYLHLKISTLTTVARTLADLDGVEGVGRLHVAEALSYRRIALTR